MLNKTILTISISLIAIGLTGCVNTLKLSDKFIYGSRTKEANKTYSFDLPKNHQFSHSGKKYILKPLARSADHAFQVTAINPLSKKQEIKINKKEDEELFPSSKSNDEWYLTNKNHYAIQVANFNDIKKLQKFLKKNKSIISISKVDTWIDAEVGRRYTVFYEKVYSKTNQARADLNSVSKKYRVTESQLWVRSFSKLKKLRCRDLSRQLNESESDKTQADLDRIKHLRTQKCEGVNV